MKKILLLSTSITLSTLLFTGCTLPFGKYLEALKDSGVKVDTIDLPSRGIFGNSHMIMMDKNSDQVAQIVQDWIRENGLMK